MTPDRDWSAVCIGRPKSGTTPRGSGARVGPHDDAVDVLRDLVAIYDAGRREPLPLPDQDVLRLGGRPALRRRPGARGGVPVEVQRSIPRRRSGARARAGLGQERPAGRPDAAAAAGRGEFDSEDNRLGAYAVRLWLPLLRAERDPG